MTKFSRGTTGLYERPGVRAPGRQHPLARDDFAPGLLTTARRTLMVNKRNYANDFHNTHRDVRGNCNGIARTP